MKYISYMPQIILNKKTEKIKGNPLTAFEKLGIQFSCHTGICGTCKIRIKKGIENINIKSESEEYFPLDQNERLACQCKKIKGDIEIENAI